MCGPSMSVELINIDRGGIHTAPLTDDADTLEFLDSMDVDKAYQGIDRASELGMVMKLDNEIRVAVIDLLSPNR